MLVLGGIAFIVAALCLYWFTQYLNTYTSNRFRFELFEWGSGVGSMFAYLSMFFGNSWYVSAVRDGADTLNGSLVVIIGIITLLVIEPSEQVQLFFTI